MLRGLEIKGQIDLWSRGRSKLCEALWFGLNRVGGTVIRVFGKFCFQISGLFAHLQP